MKIIAFHVEKGGTGKTTLAGNSSYVLSKMAKTLLVDGDPQGNATSWFATNSMEWELADVLENRVSLENAVKKIRSDLYLLPSFGLDGNLKHYSETTLFQRPYAFLDLIDTITASDFEVAVFDLGPGISNLEKSILSAMHEVIGVAAPETFSADGLEVFENELQKLRKDRRAQFEVNKLVVNRINLSYSLHVEYLKQFNALDYEIFTIGQSTSLSDCVPRHLSLHEFDPKNKNVTEIERLASAIKES